MKYTLETTKQRLQDQLLKSGLRIIYGLEDYKTQYSMLVVECEHGHQREVKAKTIKETPYCPTCLEIKIKSDFTKLVEKENYKLLEEYVNADTKILIECPKGHRYKVKPKDFRFGQRCAKCYYKTKTKEDFVDLATKRGFKIKGVYKNNTTELDYECSNGHHFTMTPRKVRQGYFCPFCRRGGFRRTRPTYFYLVKWTKKKQSFLKFGITNRPVHRRIHQQELETTFKPELLECRWCISGEQCVELETHLKKMFPTHVIDREHFRDGFSETIHYKPETVEILRPLIKGLR